MIGPCDEDGFKGARTYQSSPDAFAPWIVIYTSYPRADCQTSSFPRGFHSPRSRLCLDSPWKAMEKVLQESRDAETLKAQVLVSYLISVLLSTGL